MVRDVAPVDQATLSFSTLYRYAADLKAGEGPAAECVLKDKVA